MNFLIKYSIIALAFLGLFLGPKISAQQTDEIAESNITAFPALLEHTMDRGETYKTNLVLVNSADKPIPLSIEVKSLIPSEYIIDLSKRSQFDASRWIKVDPKNIALKAGETKRIKLEISAPKDASPGGHYAEIIIKQFVLETNQSSDITQTKIIPQLKVPVLLSINGDAKDEIIIESEDKFPQIIQSFSSLNTKVTLANTGTTHLLPNIRIDVLGSDKVLQTVNNSPGIILPNTKRDFEIPWDPNVPIGLYDVKVSVIYGDNSKMETAETERVLVMFPLIFIFGLILLSGLAGFLLAKRHNIKKAILVLKNPSP